MDRTVYAVGPDVLYPAGKEPVMGLPAFKSQFEAMAVAVLSAPATSPEIVEVLTLGRARIVRPVNKVVARVQALGATFRASKTEMPDFYERVTDKTGDGLQEAIAASERLLASLARPVLEDKSGVNVAKLLEGLSKTWASRSRQDGQFALQLSRKLRSAGTACDVERIAYRTVLLELVDRMKGDLAVLSAVQERDAGRHAHDDLFTRSMKRYPRITAHLAQ